MCTAAVAGGGAGVGSVHHPPHRRPHRQLGLRACGVGECSRGVERVGSRESGVYM